jgi:hypothetical protein
MSGAVGYASVHGMFIVALLGANAREIHHVTCEFCFVEDRRVVLCLGDRTPCKKQGITIPRPMP